MSDRRIVSKLGNTLVAMARLFKRSLKKKFGTLVKDAVIIEGIVEITNGDTHIIARNSVVNQGLAALVSFLSVNALNAVSTVPAYTWTTISNSSMRVGSDTITSTTAVTTLLSSPIGAGIGTAPNTQTIANSNPAADQWQVTYTATWIAGSLAELTLGEVGLFVHIWTAAQGLQPAGGTSGSPVGNTLFSRMAAADGKFGSFVINPAAAVNVTWVINFKYVV